MKKLVSILIIVTLVLGVLAGCANFQQAKDTSATSSTAQATQSAAAQTTAAETTTAKYPLTLTDAGGTSATIAGKPSKIVSMPLGVCETLVSLVDKNSIAAMTNFADDQNLSNIADKVKGVGKRLDSNAEKIIALQPDLVLVDTLAQKDFVKQLRDAKLTVFVVNMPSNIDQEKDVVKVLGTITDEDAKASDIIKWMDSKLKEVSDKVSTLKEDQRLSILDYSEMSTTSGKGTNFDDIVSKAGLINPVAKAGMTGWPQLSKEMIVKYNPDLINLPSWYYDTKVNYNKLSNSIKGDKALAGVKAVKNNKLVSLPFNHLSTTSQYSVLAVEDMAKAAYPELFK